MQNKGTVRVLSIALALVSLYYLSFSFVTGYYNGKAAEYAGGDKEMEYQYLDSLSGEKVYMGYTLKECREREINLGLDLKGGMNVTLEVSVSDILKALSGYNSNPEFNKALQLATERQKTNSQSQYLDLFVSAFHELDPNARLSSVFSTFELKDKISLNSTDDQVVSVLKGEIDAAISNSFAVLRERIDRFGVVSPNIQRDNNSLNRILIELPGVKEQDRVRKLLQGSANLEFWETYDLSEIVSNISEANRVLGALKNVADSSKTAAPVAKTTQTAVAKSAVDSLKAALANKSKTASDSAANVEKSRKENPLFTVLQLNLSQDGQVGRGPVVGMARYTDTARINGYFKLKAVKDVLPRDLALKWTIKSIDPNGEVYQLVAIKLSGRDGRAPLGGEVITDAKADFTQQSAYANVSMSMNSEGAKTWARLTKDNIGKSVAIVLDNYVYSFPTVQVEITGGSSQITGNFSVDEAKDLANTLKSGKMLAPARIIQEDIVGPSLGQESINKGFISFIIAFVLILVYMLIWYGGVPGLIADAALFINIFFLMGILASFSAVLTLPGIAGIVLTLGMAVDSNVLIYERIREELHAGKTMRRSIDEGFSNALSAIIDANVTTLLTGVILAIFGTGPIKGFAVTLVIGIITTFITAVFLTRLMVETWANKNKTKEVPFETRLSKGFLKNTKFKIIDNRKWAYIFSATIVVISIVSLFTRGLNTGIDFTGGRNYKIEFDQPVHTQDVRDKLAASFEGTTFSVISVTNDRQVRVSTKYKYDDPSATVDSEIEGKLYQGLKPFLNGISKDEFVAKHILGSTKVGPTIADDIKTSAFYAVILAILGIGIYILMRFRTIGYSVGAVVSLAHDAIIVIGAYSLLYSIMPFSLEVDLSFIAAILTVIGYSVNDTVIIYDRIREYTKLYPKRDRKTVINDALNHTMSRTFSTTFTVIIVLVAIFIFGGDSIRNFIFAMLFGIFFGVYSSLFVASPITYEIHKRMIKRKGIQEENE